MHRERRLAVAACLLGAGTGPGSASSWGEGAKIQSPGHTWRARPAGDHELDLLRLVVVRLQGIEHAVLVQDVVEVLRMVAVTPLAEAPPWLRGVIDLRGQVVPVIDLRRRLGMPERAPDLTTPILVVRGRGVTAGLVADEVVEVLALPSRSWRPSEAMTNPGSAVSAAIRHGDRLLLILDTDRICEGSADLPLQDAGRLG